MLDDQEKEAQADEEEALQLISTVKGMFGLSEDDPADSSWLHMFKKDFATDTRVQMGKVCISLEVLPQLEATLNDNGFGRSDPNHSPALPPPVGRLKWSWNPFVLGSQICGPTICFYFTCCIFVSAFILMMIFCQPLMNLFIQAIFTCVL